MKIVKIQSSPLQDEKSMCRNEDLPLLFQASNMRHLRYFKIGQHLVQLIVRIKRMNQCDID
jgi:hypothetical protein